MRSPNKHEINIGYPDIVKELRGYTTATPEQVKEVLHGLRSLTIKHISQGENVHLFPGLLIHAQWKDAQTLRYFDAKNGQTCEVPGCYRAVPIITKRFRTTIKDAYLKGVDHSQPCDTYDTAYDLELEEPYKEEDIWA